VADPEIRKDHVIAFSEAPSTLGQLFLGRYIIAHTSGTTGFKGYFVYHTSEWLRMMGAMMLLEGRLNVTCRDVLAVMTGPFRRIPRVSIVATGSHYIDILFHYIAPPVITKFMRREIISITDPLDSVVDRLNELRPRILNSYPTMIEALARERLAGRLTAAPARIISTSEPLTPESRALIEEAFGRVLWNVYGATESCVMAKQCSAGEMHIWEDLAILEPIGADGRPVAAGEPSRKLLVTNLISRTMPIIRYEVDDTVVPLEGACSCGSSLGRIEVIGRTEDTFWVREARGRFVPLLPLALGVTVAELRGVRQFQIRQEERNAVRILFIPDIPSEDQEIGALIEKNFRSFLDRHGLRECVSVRAERVDEIPRLSGGKLRRIYSTVGPPDDGGQSE